MHCELVVPGLFGDRREAAAARRSSCCSRAAGATTRAEPQSLERGCTRRFDLEEEAIPAGALSAARRQRRRARRSDAWLRADPVHLRLMRDHLVVVPAEALAISRGGGRRVCAALNRHFAGAMQVRALRARALVRAAFDQDARPRRRPAAEASPAGEIALAARATPRSSTEIQMVLHAHPVERGARSARRADGQQPLALGRGPRGARRRSRWAVVARGRAAGHGARPARAARATARCRVRRRAVAGERAARTAGTSSCWTPCARRTLSKSTGTTTASQRWRATGSRRCSPRCAPAASAW